MSFGLAMFSSKVEAGWHNVLWFLLLRVAMGLLVGFQVPLLRFPGSFFEGAWFLFGRLVATDPMKHLSS